MKTADCASEKDVDAKVQNLNLIKNRLMLKRVFNVAPFG